MTRRGFLSRLVALAAAPIAGVLPVAAGTRLIGVDAAIPGADHTNVLLRGELGRWEGVTFVTVLGPDGNERVQLWA